MGKRRGFFAEMQHQAALAERQRQRQNAAAVQQQVRLHREAERAHAAAKRAQLQADRTDARAAAEADREAKRLHIEAMEAEVSSLNADLTEKLAQIDGILSATLEVDDFVDLEDLRVQVTHPSFVSAYSKPLAPPDPILAPPEPVFEPPIAPKGIGGMFGGKKKHEAEVAAAKLAFEQQHATWRAFVGDIPRQQLTLLQAHKRTETHRVEGLARDQVAYEAACAQREEQAAVQNAQLDELIRKLALGEQEAVEQYAGIVLGNSLYPEGVDVEIEHEFDPILRELTLSVIAPTPESIPTTRQFKYVKAKDEVAESAQPVREQKDRYAALIHNIALRTMHEIWESDREGKIRSISLTVGVSHVDPAIGTDTVSPLLAVAAEREDFLRIDLSRVTPAETLKHLRATLSKDPRGLQAIDVSRAVKG